ncbi:MAG: arginase [Clostridiaceae bacterium]|nr:arginase [Clostridiaceae bacterium]
MKTVYFVNNFSGVHVPGLKDSVYTLREKLNSNGIVIEEKNFTANNIVSNNSAIDIFTADNFVSNNSEADIFTADKYKTMKNYSAIFDICTRSKAYACEIFAQGNTPVMIAGDHSIGMASVAATAANYNNLGLVWVDAHSDINTDTTSITGNIHGMPIASLLGLGSQELTQLSGEKACLKPENILYLGLRDLDPAETEFINNLPIKAYYYDEIAVRGLNEVLAEIKTTWHTENIHLSFDFDSMDPQVMPGVSVPVPGGFTENDAFTILDFFKNNFKCRSYDFVEYNRTKDVADQSLNTCLKLIKSILDD